MVDVGQTLAEVGQIRPIPARFSQVRAELGRSRDKLGRVRRRYGWFWSTFGRLGAKFEHQAEVGRSRVESCTNVGRCWAKLDPSWPNSAQSRPTPSPYWPKSVEMPRMCQTWEIWPDFDLTDRFRHNFGGRVWHDLRKNQPVSEESTRTMLRNANRADERVLDTAYSF